MKSSPPTGRKGNSGSTSGGKGRREPHVKGSSLTTPWGNFKAKSSRNRFYDWLHSKKDASFLTGKPPGSFRLYMRLSRRMQIALRAHLAKVDPVGYAGFRKMYRSWRVITLRMRRVKAQLLKDKVAPDRVVEDDIAVRTMVDEAPGMSVVRFMDMPGLKKILALACAAGYQRSEVAAIAGMTLEDFNALVTQDDVSSVASTLPEAIVRLADQKVAKDLLAGTLGKETEIAEKIAQGRRKIVLGASAEGRARRKEAEELELAREKHIRERFGVDRKATDAGGEEAR